MADSNITKRALAAALKELMEEKAFDKISVGDICEKCDMNRKSFYCHFRELLLSIIANRLQNILCVEAIQDFQAD